MTLLLTLSVFAKKHPKKVMEKKVIIKNLQLGNFSNITLITIGECDLGRYDTRSKLVPATKSFESLLTVCYNFEDSHSDKR